MEQNSGGTLKIEFVTEYAPGDPHQWSKVIADVRSGAIDLGMVAARTFDVNGYDEFQPLLAPFLVDSYDLQARVFEEGIPAQMASGLDRIGVTAVGRASRPSVPDDEQGRPLHQPVGLPGGPRRRPGIHS